MKQTINTCIGLMFADCKFKIILISQLCVYYNFKQIFYIFFNFQILHFYW